MDSLGRASDVCAGPVFPGLDQIHGNQGVWITELAALGTDQFSAGAARCCRRDYGARVVSEPVSRNASNASPGTLRSNRRSALSPHFDATGFRGVHHLGASLISVVICWGNTSSISSLHSAVGRDRTTPSGEPRIKTVSAGTTHRFCPS